MNTPGNPSPDRLKEAFQRKFSDFEPEPTRTLLPDILDKVHATSESTDNHRPAGKKRWAGPLLLCCFFLHLSTPLGLLQPETPAFLKAVSVAPTPSVKRSVPLPAGERLPASVTTPPENPATASGHVPPHTPPATGEALPGSGETGTAPLARQFLASLPPLPGPVWPGSIPVQEPAMPEVTAVSSSGPPPSEETAGEKVTLVAGGSFFHTSHLVTVLPQENLFLTNFRLPGIFAGNTWTGEFHAGAAWRHWQLTGEFQWFNQEIAYESAKDEFHIRDLPGNSYKIVRVSTPDEIRKTTFLFGAGLQRKFILRTSGTYVGAGVSYNRALSGNQSVWWGKVFAGRRWKTGANLHLSAEPFIRYSIFRIDAGREALQTQPYQFGISVGLTQ